MVFRMRRTKSASSLSRQVLEHPRHRWAGLHKRKDETARPSQRHGPPEKRQRLLGLAMPLASHGQQGQDSDQLAGVVLCLVQRCELSRSRSSASPRPADDPSAISARQRVTHGISNHQIITSGGGGALVSSQRTARSGRPCRMASRASQESARAEYAGSSRDATYSRRSRCAAWASSGRPAASVQASARRASPPLPSCGGRIFALRTASGAGWPHPARTGKGGRAPADSRSRPRHRSSHHL